MVCTTSMSVSELLEVLNESVGAADGRAVASLAGDDRDLAFAAEGLIQCVSGEHALLVDGFGPVNDAK